VRSVQASGMILSWFQRYGTNGKPAFRRRANRSWLSANCIHFADIAAWSRKSLTIFTQKLTFLERKTTYGQIFTMFFRKDSWRHRSTYCMRISWNLANRKSVSRRALLTRQKNNISARSPALTSARIAPKICQGQLQTIYSECPKSVHFRRSCSRTREHRWNSPWSVSSTRQSYSFFAE